MQGLWLYVATGDHPHSYDVRTGPTLEHHEYNIGAVIDAVEGDSSKTPQEPGAHKYFANYFRWLFYAGRTVADLQQRLADDGDAEPDVVIGKVRILDWDTGSNQRGGDSLDSNLRFKDKRTLTDKLLGR